MRPARFVLSALLCSAASCAPLPEIDRGVCGNAVIDLGEDCDSFSRYGSACRPPGEVGACHLDCSLGPNGERGSCPTDWGCGLDSICRPPTSDFDEVSTFGSGDGLELASGDFDGDGRADLVGAEPLDRQQLTRVRLHYFDEQSALEETRAFAKVLYSPVIAELSGDGRSDLLFSDPRLGLLLGSADRSWVSKAFGSYPVEGSSLRMFEIYDREDAPVVALATRDGVPGIYLPDALGDQLRRVLTLPRKIEDFIGDPVLGNVIESAFGSPCSELLYAFQGDDTFSMVDFCRREDSSQPVSFLPEALETRIALDPPAQIQHAPLVVDADGDGHLDVLIGAADIAYLARGDGKGLATAKPYFWQRTGISPENRFEAMSTTIPMPLAAGDVSADGRLDFVFEHKLVVSVPDSPFDPPQYRTDNELFGVPWTEAKIGDLNRDGRLDVMAASSERLDLDYFNGTNSEHLPHVNISTKGPAQHLAFGDYDGDGVDDVAFAEKADIAGELDRLEIAFGNPSGPPSAPQHVTSMASIEQVETLRTPSISNLMVSSVDWNGPQKTGVLTIFDGNAARIPFAAYELTEFSQKGSLNPRWVFGLSAGAFTAPGNRDVVALATKRVSDPQQTTLEWEFWLMRSVDRLARFAEVLPARLPVEDLEPGFIERDEDGLNLNLNLNMRLASASADLDGDGSTEAIFAMPTRGGLRCGVLTLGDRDDHFATPRVVILDEPCQRPRLTAADADRDGAAELVLLSGEGDDRSRKVLVLWNDGQGNFSKDDVSVISAPGEGPRQFALLPNMFNRPFSIAYVTEQSVKIASHERYTHGFSEAVVLSPLRGGSGLASGDFNGDGVIDLALAESGQIALFRARLEAR